MPLASKTFTDEAKARSAMRRLIQQGYDKAGVRLRRPMDGRSFEVSVDVDAADQQAARLLDEVMSAPAVSRVREMALGNPLGALAAAFAGGYLAHVILRR